MKKTLVILVVIVLIWTIWANSGKSVDDYSTEANLEVIETIESGDSTGRNIVGIQPYMVPTDYLTPALFRAKLNAYFKAASDKGFFQEGTVVLLPEYIGTWLAIIDEKTAVAEAGTLNEAMATLLISNPFAAGQHMFIGQNESELVAPALFRMKANQMAQVYQEVFSSLAKTYQVTIVAGSIVLPEATIVDHQIVVNLRAPLYNRSFVFLPDGKVHPHVIKKVYPISSEQGFTRSAPVEELQEFELPIGHTSVLICADSWYPNAYATISQVQPEILLVPSYCAGNGTMDTNWKGYDGASMPADVPEAAIGSMTEQQAWINYALPGRIAQSGATYGMNVFLRGELWDLGTDGEPFLVANGQLIPITPTEKGGIWNLTF